MVNETNVVFAVIQVHSPASAFVIQQTDRPSIIHAKNTASAHLPESCQTEHGITWQAHLVFFTLRGRETRKRRLTEDELEEV